MSMKFVLFIYLFVLAAAVKPSASASHSKEDVKLPVRDVIYVFDDNGVSIADPKTNNLTKIIDKSTKILGTNEPLWHPNPKSKEPGFYPDEAQYVPDRYIFALDYNRNQIIVIDIEKRLPVKAIKTNFVPAKIEYFAETDEVWVFGRPPNRAVNIIGVRSSASGGISKMKDVNSLVLKQTINIQVVNKSSCCVKFQARNCHNQDAKQDFVVAWFEGEPGLHVLSIAKKRYVGFVNLTSYGCKSIYDFAYSPVKRFAFVKCKNVAKNVIVDVAKQRVVDWKDRLVPNSKGYPVSSPDGKYIVVFYSDKKSSTWTSYYLGSASKPIIRLPNINSLTSQNSTRFYFLNTKNGYTVYEVSYPFGSVTGINLQQHKDRLTQTAVIQSHWEVEIKHSLGSYVSPLSPACSIDDRYVVVGIANKTVVVLMDEQNNDKISLIRGFKNARYMVWVGNTSNTSSTYKPKSSAMSHYPDFVLMFTALLLVFSVAGKMFL